MAEERVTTVQIGEEIDRKLRVLAQANHRSKVGQVNHMVAAEYEKLMVAMPLAGEDGKEEVKA